MAFRNYRFSHLHQARDLGVAALTASHAIDSEFPLDFLIDDRAGINCKFATSQTAPWFQLDLGAGFSSDMVDRLIIPAGNVLGSTVVVLQDDNAGFSSGVAISPVAVVTSGDLIDVEFTSTQTERYLRVQSAGTFKMEAPELTLTKVVRNFSVAGSPGPLLVDAPDSYRHNFLRFETTAGMSPTLQLGARQRVATAEWEKALTGADLVAMKAFLADVEMHHPFYVDLPSFSTPPETDEPVLWMKFDEEPDRRFATRVPVAGVERRKFTLEFIESLD